MEKMSDLNYWIEKCAKLRKDAEKRHPSTNYMSEQNQSGSSNDKICPFSMSHPDGLKLCTPQCMLYRPKKRGYECYLMELQSISWFLKKGKSRPAQGS